MNLIRAGCIISLAIFSVKCQTYNEEMEKESIYTIIKQLHAWHNSDNYLIVKVQNASFPWALERLPGFRGNANFELSTESMHEHAKRKISDLTNKGICTGEFINILNQRLNNEEQAFHLGMILTDHEWGDNLRNFVVPKDFLDYLPSFDSEGYNSVFERNTSFSDTDVDNWHKNRITVISAGKAEYKLLYTEAGLSVERREKAFLKISFIKTNNIWNVNNISITEVSKKEILDLYELNQ